MPELPEVEAYRRLAESALDRPIAIVAVHDPRFLRGETPPARVKKILVGASFCAARRIGKLLVLDLAGTPAATDHRLGLRFGMTGSLFVDGLSAVDELIYSSRSRGARWDRFGVIFTDGGSLVVHDPRLLGGVALDPDESALGPDAMTLTPAQLRHALEGSAAPLKARLLDQARIAGVGNLLADEILWRASLNPNRRAGSLTPAEIRRLHRHLRVTLDELSARGGSHLGDLMPQRHPGGRCPRDGAELRRSTVGGRTSWWCPRHQR
ncbi:MAG TPA: DNA-formamidopyrimidine glycosylase family protein [Acidimicrobiales bacterium]|nr:DNA-formamidopyrimidine glycosylase family protein [Acidimicrobiales bacterium]